jgi:hypothetical protein
MAVAPEVLRRTRESLHRVAEHVLSPARHAATGRIGLRPHPGGLRTPPFGPDETMVAVELDELVVHRAGRLERRMLTTLREAAAFVGVTPGAPADVYPPATPCDPDAPLMLDRAAMQALSDWYLLGADALARLADQLADDEPTETQLWPEHLDLAISAGRVNYGVSPGDAAIDEPYAYVGPHALPPPSEGFWNQPFGAARTWGELRDADRVLAFFLEGRRRRPDSTGGS